MGQGFIDILSADFDFGTYLVEVVEEVVELRTVQFYVNGIKSKSEFVFEFDKVESGYFFGDFADIFYHR